MEYLVMNTHPITGFPLDVTVKDTGKKVYLNKGHVRSDYMKTYYKRNKERLLAGMKEKRIKANAKS